MLAACVPRRRRGRLSCPPAPDTSAQNHGGPRHEGGGSTRRYVLRLIMVLSCSSPPSNCRRHNLLPFQVLCYEWDRNRRNSPKPHFSHGFSLFGFTEHPDFQGACADPSIGLKFMLTDNQPAFLSYLPQPRYVPLESVGDTLKPPI